MTARQARQQMLNPNVAIHTLECQAENSGANQDEQHEARQLHGGVHGLTHEFHVNAIASHGHDQGTYGTHGATFCGGCNAQENGPKHQENKCQRRNEHKSHALCHVGQQAHFGHFVEKRSKEGKTHTHTHRDHDGFICGRCVRQPFGKADCDGQGDSCQDGQRPKT